MNTDQILSILTDAGFYGVMHGGANIIMEDPSCILRSFETFIEYAWVVITALAGLMLFGWAISVIRGGTKLAGLAINIRNLFLIFGALSAALPIMNFIFGDDLVARGCKTVTVDMANVNALLESKNFAVAASLPTEIPVFDSGTLMEFPESDTGIIRTPGQYDGFAFGGQCSASATSNVFENGNFTTNQYADTDAAFNKAMNTIFRAEGGYVNDPFDSGGETKYGISKNNNPDIDVANITRADAERIAHERYYTKYGINNLPDAIRGEVFQVGWHCGPATAIKQLQGILGVAKTGRVDSVTVTAAREYNGNLTEQYINTYRDYMIGITRRKPSQQRFLRGWMNRVDLVRDNGCHS